MVNSVTGAPVKISIKFRISQAAILTTRPMAAEVIVERAEAAVLGSPPEKIILKPPAMSIKKKTRPATVVRTERVLEKRHSRPLMVATSPSVTQAVFMSNQL